MGEETNNASNDLDPLQKPRLKETLLTCAEGRLLLTGVAMAFMYILWLGMKLLFSPQDSQVLIGMTATQIMFGRAVAMAFGYSLGLGHPTIIAMSMVIETILVLIFYPLFVFSWQHLLTVKWLRKIFDRTEKTAENRKAFVQKYGIIGLFVFVWFPFWMTGPVVGCVIGFLIGLRVWVNITVVLAGTYIAILGWAFFLRQIHEQVASYSSYAAMILLAILLIILIAAHILHRTRYQNKHKT